MYSPWTTSMPCLFSNLQTNLTYNNSTDCLTNSFNNLNLSNPLNFLASSSIRSLNHFPTEHKEVRANYFEPLPFFETNYQSKYKTQPQLSQKHTMIKQMIARKDKQLSTFQRSNHLSAANSNGQKRQICTFCKSNGESASVYTSHVLRTAHREIQCPVLLAYVCPKCGATGKSAHTIKYCTALSENERVALPTVKNFKEGRSSSGKKNLFKK